MLTLLWYCGAAQTPVQTDLRSFLPAVGRIEAAGYDSHVELRWPAVSGAESYAVYLLRDGKKSLRGETPNLYYLDFVAGLGRNAVYTYRVAALGADGKRFRKPRRFQPRSRTFRTNSSNKWCSVTRSAISGISPIRLTGLAYERSNDKRADCITTGGSGFGVMGIVAGVRNGFCNTSGGSRTAYENRRGARKTAAFPRRMGALV